MVHDDNLREEGFNFSRRVVIDITTDITSLEIFNSNIFNIESNIIARDSLGDRLMMPLYRSNLSFNVPWSKDNTHSRLKNTSLDSSNWDCTDSSDFVNILQWQSQWLFSGSFRRLDLV
jgi:hypothetical protein